MSLVRRPSPEILIRSVGDADAKALIAVIGSIRRSYPAVAFDLGAELSESKAPAEAFARAGVRI